MLEGTVERAAIKWARENGWLVRKIRYIGRTAATDRFFIKNSHVVFIEFKAPGESLRISQRRERNKLIAAGANYHCVDSLDDAIAALQGYCE